MVGVYFGTTGKHKELVTIYNMPDYYYTFSQLNLLLHRQDVKLFFPTTLPVKKMKPYSF